MLRMLILLTMVATITSCSSRSSGDLRFDWDMDPRLAALQEWSYACVMEVSGLDPNELPAPNVLGVDEPWGIKNYFGTYYHSKRLIKVQITRPESHVADILHHENGHGVDYRVNGKSESEDYPNWVNDQCREKNMPHIYPAPRIDWDATTAQVTTPIKNGDIPQK